MTDYFLEEWDEEPPQPDPCEWWLKNTIPGLRSALRLSRADADDLFLNTNAILRTMQISDEHKTKLQSLGYLEDLVF